MNTNFTRRGMWIDADTGMSPFHPRKLWWNGARAAHNTTQFAENDWCGEWMSAFGCSGAFAGGLAAFICERTHHLLPLIAQLDTPSLLGAGLVAGCLFGTLCGAIYGSCATSHMPLVHHNKH